MKYADVASIPGPDMSDFEYYEVSPAYIQTEVSRVLAAPAHRPELHVDGLR